MINPKLKGKTALITGANHGIGAATAKALTAQGVNVFISYLALPVPDNVDTSDIETPGMGKYHHLRGQNADAVLAEIKTAGGNAQAIEADLSKPDTIPALFDAAENAFGPVDILVHNAAHWEAGTFIPQGEATANGAPEQWSANGIPTFTPAAHDASFAVNARAGAHLITEFAQRHVKRNADYGRIVTISTDAASSFPSEAIYGASKFALESYSRSAANELGQFGITINIVSPGPTQTGYIPPDFVAEMAARTPLRRIGEPEDIADVIVFLASEQARWLTGQLLYVGGGHQMHRG